MARSPRFSASLTPPEPARTLSVHLLRAAAQLAPLPRWLERYPLGAMSPGARQLAWSVGRRVTANPDHGFAMAERVPAEAVGTLWSLYEAAPSLAAVHREYVSLAPLLLDCMRPTIAESEGAVALSFVSDTGLLLDRGEQDFRAAMQVKTWRTLLHDPRVAPLCVHFTYARPASTRAHERALGTTRLLFSQPVLRYDLATSVWHAPVPTHEAKGFAEHRRKAHALLTAYQRQTIESTVEGLVTEFLGSDRRETAIAGALGLSQRTLRRRLGLRGVSFRALIERVQRRELSLIEEADELAEGSLPLRDRARLLGFANTGALRNALKRWRIRASASR